MTTTVKASMIASLLLVFQLPVPGVHMGIPPVSLFGSDKGRPIIAIGDLRGSVTYWTEEKLLTIEWTEIDPSTGEGGLVVDQDIRLSYWPTETLAGGKNELIVAGKRSHGATCIEIFTFEAPILNSPTGAPPFLGPAPIVSIDEIYSESTVSRDMVTHMFRQQGANGDGLFVQFWDSKDVYLISKTTGNYSLIASPASHSLPVLSEPMLDKDWTDSFGANHNLLGYLYGFVNGGISEDLGVVFLVDDDASRDGVIDYVLYMTPRDWTDMDMGLASFYSPLPE